MVGWSREAADRGTGYGRRQVIPTQYDRFFPFGKMFKIKMPREESDGRLNHCSQKTRKGCNENENSVGERASGLGTARSMAMARVLKTGVGTFSEASCPHSWSSFATLRVYSAVFKVQETFPQNHQRKPWLSFKLPTSMSHCDCFPFIASLTHEDYQKDMGRYIIHPLHSLPLFP